VSTYPMIYAANMTDQQRAIYYAELSVVQKDEVLGVLLAVFLGTFGAHQFYLRRTGLGILYCCLSVTGFSTIAGFVEAFFMPELVRRFNAAQAGAIATRLGFYTPSGQGNFAPASGVSGYGFSGSAVPAYGVPAAGFVPMAAGFAPVGPTEIAVPTVCPSCGASVAAGVNFCGHCGTAVRHDAAPQGV
jgi:TM2 domain-containing membrane protein YozV